MTLDVDLRARITIAVDYFNIALVDRLKAKVARVIERRQNRYEAFCGSRRDAAPSGRFIMMIEACRGADGDMM